MTVAMRLLTAILLLGASAPANAHAAITQQAPAVTTRSSSMVAPKAGWEKPSCSKARAALDESTFGALAGLALVGLPALALALAGYRKAGVALAMVGALGGASAMAYVYWAVAPEPVCGSYNSPADIDAHVDSDSLYRLWTRFAVERDATRQHVLATAILCERHRLSALEPWGADAITLAQSRVAPREVFERLNERVHALIGNPEPGPMCNTSSSLHSERLPHAATGSDQPRR